MRAQRLLMAISTAQVLLTAAMMPAAADVVVDVSLTFQPPGPPSFPEIAVLDGTVTFLGAGPDANFTAGAANLPTGLVSGDTFSAILHPPQPCFAHGTCALDFSFVGTAGGFPAFAFASGETPTETPPGPPIIPIGTLSDLLPAVQASGDLFAFDGAVQVGTWRVTMTDVPEPASVALLASALTGFIAFRRRGRKRLT
jgi:hypothetical protein